MNQVALREVADGFTRMVDVPNCSHETARRMLRAAALDALIDGAPEDRPLHFYVLGNGQWCAIWSSDGLGSTRQS